MAALARADERVPSFHIARPPAAVRAYWTRARMREARPAEALAPSPLATVPDRAAPARAAKRHSLHRRVRKTGSYPNRTAGKIFFTLPGDGPDAGDYSCSGTAVRSPSRSLVWTAGHCVFDPGALGAGYATNWEFVPAYSAGSKPFTAREPFGEWPAVSLATPTRWHGSDALAGGDFAFDLGAATVSPHGGVPLQDRIGARRIAFDQPRNLKYSAFGYPAFGPPPEFDGRHLFRCRSAYRGSDHRIGPPAPIGISCDLTEGASGGGWVVRRHHRGYVVSVTSYGYKGQPNKLYGPYQGNAAQRLWQSAGG
jgi:hypothetical protein